MKKLIALSLTLAAMFPLTTVAQVIVRIGPPPPHVAEVPIPPPGPRYVWQPGYYWWAGARYVWISGHYVLPPHPGGVWIAPRWAMRGGSWGFVEGS